MHSPIRRPPRASKRHRISLLWVAICLLLTFLAFPVSHASAGCPWTDASPVTVTPATPCLSLSARQGAGGCVHPEITGVNNCTDALTIWIVGGPKAGAYRFEPGEQVQVLVDLEAGRPTNDGNRYDFELPAKLGEKELKISFYTYRRSTSCLGMALLLPLVAAGALSWMRCRSRRLDV